MRLLHLADVHLGASYSAFGELATERGDAVLEAFRRLPKIAEEREIHAVLIAGDLFDTPRPDTSLLAATRETLRRLVEAGRPVFLVPGNHDSNLVHPNPYRDSLGGAHVFVDAAFGDPVTVETDVGRLCVYGFAYDRATEPDPLVSFRRSVTDAVHVALLHGSVQDAPHWSASGNALRLTAEQLVRLDVDYIALGDYHRFRPPDEFPGVPACYSGSFAARDLTETGPRGFVIVDSEPAGTPRVTHVPSPVAEVRDVGQIDVGRCESEMQVADEIAAGLPDAIVPVVTLVGEPAFSLDAQVVLAQLEQRFGHAKVVDRSRFFSSARLEEVAEQDTLAGHVVRLARRRVEQAEDDDSRRTADRALRIALRSLGVS